jgi:hypothetical protein
VVGRTGVELRKCGSKGGGGQSPTEQSEGGGRVKEERKTDKRERGSKGKGLRDSIFGIMSHAEGMLT